MSEITPIREKLLKLNQELVQLLIDRSTLVQQIQSKKNRNTTFWCYDAKRELDVFTEMSGELSSLSDRELLALSLIMESQANVAEHSYPAWSQKVHLINQANRLYEMINPNLLFVSRKEYYRQLDFGPGFDTINEI
jgi:chorismate mutase